MTRPRTIVCLTPRDVPEPAVGDSALGAFALTFHGYEYWGGFLQCAAVNVRVLALRPGRLHEATLEELRTALFFSQRAKRHGGVPFRYGAVADIVEAIRTKVSDEDSIVGSSRDPFLDDCFRAMAHGIERNERMLAGVMARVAPENTAVSAALDGLLSFTWGNDDDYAIALEATHPGVAKRVDMIITPHREPAEEPLLLEWKVLWQIGRRECVRGIQRDLDKLAGRRGLVMVLAYALSDVPKGCEKRRTDVALEDTVAKAEQELKRTAVLRSRPRGFEQRDVRGEYQLLAWRS